MSIPHFCDGGDRDQTRDHCLGFVCVLCVVQLWWLISCGGGVVAVMEVGGLS
jgi:hypothetical protein